MNNEIWKDVPGFEGYYQVSNLGNIFSLINNRKMKITINKRGYCQTMFCGNVKKKNIRVHIIVAKAFIPNTKNKPAVNHINGIRHDNRIENLEWVTNKENIAHAIKTGLLDFSKIKYRNGKERKVIKISTGEMYNSLKECAKANNINIKTFSNKIAKNEYTEYKYFIPMP
jgi:hypothetical protein